MEKPLPQKQFKRKIRQDVIAGILVLILGFAGAYLKGCFNKKENPVTLQNITVQTLDSSPQNTTNNNGTVTVNRDQNNAGRNIKNDNKKIDVHGNAFFDSSKQVNYYQGLKQRHIDSPLMKKILDSIPSKKIRIEILAGGGKEGENLGKEITQYLVKKGFSKATISSWSLTGNWDIIEYHFDVADSTFRIDIHPQSNDQQIH